VTPGDAPPVAPPVIPAVVKPPLDPVVHPPTTPDVAPAAAVRSALPDHASRTKCKKLFEEVYATDLKDRLPAARKKLALQLLGEGAKAAEGSADRFILLTGAVQAAKDALSVRISFAAAEELARSYEVDELSAKIDAATRIFSGAPSPLIGTVYNVDALFTLADQLAAEDDFTDVARIESSLQHGIASIADPELKSAVVKQIHEMGLEREARDKAGPALEKLRKSPDDPASNATAGCYLCFQRGQWDRGLPLLARSNDPQLKSVATAELGRPTDPDSIVAIGDKWFEVAAKLPVADRPRTQEHAAAFYRSADANLTGLKKFAVEKRMAEIPETGRHRRVDLLELFDLAKSPVTGTWKLQDGLLTCDRAGVTKVGFAYTPPEEYDFRISFFVQQSGSNVSQICFAGGHQFAWHIGGWGNKISAFETIGGAGGDNNQTARRLKRWFADGQHYTSVVKVRKTGVEAYLNDQLISCWKTDYSDMGPAGWNVPGETVGLGTSNVTVRFDLAEIIEVTGEGKRLTP
jgi:hypothetical protein